MDILGKKNEIKYELNLIVLPTQRTSIMWKGLWDLKFFDIWKLNHVIETKKHKVKLNSLALTSEKKITAFVVRKML